MHISWTLRVATKMMVVQEGHSLDFFLSAMHEPKPHDRCVKQEAVSQSASGADCKQGGKNPFLQE